MCRFLEASRSGNYGYVKEMDTPAWDLLLLRRLKSVRNAATAFMVTAECIYGLKDKEYTRIQKQGYAYKTIANYKMVLSSILLTRAIFEVDIFEKEVIRFFIASTCFRA